MSEKVADIEEFEQIEWKQKRGREVAPLRTFYAQMNTTRLLQFVPTPRQQSSVLL